MSANPFAWSFRGQYLAGFALCAALLAFALYVQFGMLMLPMIRLLDRTNRFMLLSQIV